MAVLFSVSLPFFRFCSGNIAILLLLLMPPALLRFLFYNHKEIFISLQCCLCMFISRRPGMLCRPRGCTTSTAPLTAQDLRLLSLGGWERRSYSIIAVRYNIILSSCASNALTSSFLWKYCWWWYSNAVKMVTKEEALLDFHVTLIHKWIQENRRRGPAAAENLKGDRIRYYHIYFQTLYQKKGEKKHFVQSKATQHSTTSSIHIKSEWIQSSKKVTLFVLYLKSFFVQ